MQKRRLLLAMLLCAFWLVGFAQNAIKGTVKDKSGEPLIGVSVTFGNGQGTVTDIDGNFSVNAPAGTPIKVSYVGYKAQTLKGSGNMNITMEEDNTTLEDVVVVGYGTMKRRDLTGAVASVTGDKLAANPVANVAQALQGQLPGVNVMSQDGRPGATMAIRVRGGGSITQSNDPLFIVDGVQVSDISDIPADNIESIDVLKDGASTAIYGARGANGVILVTTKGSKGDGKAKVKYNMYYQIKKAPKTLDVQDAYDYVLHNWSYATFYGMNEADGIAEYFGLGSQFGNHLNDYRNVATHNYVDDVMRTAGSWSHDLSLSGGNEATKYYATVNYLTDDGIRIKSGMKRWNANFKISQKITKNLTFDADLRYSEMKIEGTNFDYAAGNSVYGYRPIDNPLGKDDSSLLSMGSSSVEASYNPLSIIDNYTNITTRQRIRGMGSLTWNVIKGLTAKTELSLSRNWSETDYWDAGKSTNPYNQAQLTKGNGYGIRWATTLNYQVQGLGEDHNLSFLLGNEVLASKSNSSKITGAGFPSEFDMDRAFGLINMYNMKEAYYDQTKKVSDFESTIGEAKHTLSWFGRVNYDFLGRYLFTATFRADGSSNFAPNNHWGYFPSAAVGWRINDEPFMANTKDWLDNLKLRLSFGSSGNDAIDASLWKEYWVPSIVWNGDKRTVTFKPGDILANPDLKWETTVSRNLGIDFGFWNGKLRGSIDLYWNTTKDILMKVPVAETTGHSYQYQNVGKTSNKGLELALFYEIYRSKDLNISVNATYNYNKNNVEEVVAGVNADTHTNWGSSMKRPYNDYIIREGEPVGTIFGYKSAGFYTVDDFDVTNGVWTLKKGVPDISGVVNYTGVGNKTYNTPEGQVAFPGVVKFEDTDGSGTVTEDDACIIGHTMPKHTGGFNINANWKGIDFSAGFAYQIGGDVYNANAMHSMMGNKNTSYGWNRLALVSDCWKMYDVDAKGDLVAVTDRDKLAAMNAGAKHALPYCEYGIVSSEFIEDASYLRLNTLTIGYTIPKFLTKKVGISNLRVYFTGGNLFCIAGYKGIDPDVNTRPGGQDGFPVPNYDWNSYPRARTYTFGLNVAF
ncbi:TonB-linked outer membrane protein, SusC/RagA family [Prevotella sp. tc2-28]|uniref:SusC/RagA family TonB-linked outer membrane protein n=1 Tax=Prevotella sp. tc2-28 TaxID=1761888 RepID=UPI0008996F86|nr:TonB-dependent receptor [Prevotella sp. tc2-28]SEA55835.1 TonB-linked outer membrane protein, SusC/RagA family [Prevotella sp. tc2-28]